MALSDFLFGAGALKKAANTGTPSTSAPAPAPAGDTSLSDMAKRNQDYADQMKAKQSAPASPLATPMGSTQKATSTKGKK